MEEKKEIKIKLNTLIILIGSLILATVIMIFVILNSNNLREDRKVVERASEEILDSDFEFKFLKLENNKQNMIYSPLSIKYALKMVNEGAYGNTKKQIEEVIGKEDVKEYENIEDILSLANGIFVKNGYENNIKNAYKKILKEKYNAEIKGDSFRNVKKINEWIEEKTLGLIKNTLDDGQIKSINSRMLLINALAINMQWEEEFDPYDTNGSDFYLDDGSKMKATTMNLSTSEDSTSFYIDEQITALSMNLKEYDDTQLEFIAIMPEENLSKYIEEFTREDFNNIMENLTLASKTKKGVDISIPKFSFDYELKLVEDLMSLGITDAFYENLADFSGISNENLYIGEALHKATIDFSEKGIRAAAVTVLDLKESIMLWFGERPVEINIDKPFLYIIKDKDSEEIFFVGTVYKPNSWAKDKKNYDK